MVKLSTTVACPYCHFRSTETMPTNVCQFFYVCKNCHAVLRPEPGKCSVCCSYGDTPCPSIQQSSAVPEM
jgi:hypothetical protein